MVEESNSRKFKYGVRRETSCRDCKKRCVGCHSTCESYQLGNEKAKEIKKLINDEHINGKDFYRVRRNFERK